MLCFETLLLRNTYASKHFVVDNCQKRMLVYCSRHYTGRTWQEGRTAGFRLNFMGARAC